MDSRVVVSAIVLVLTVALGAGVGLRVAAHVFDDPPPAPYADLFPDPENLEWVEGDPAHTLWASTNLERGITLQAASNATGLGPIEWVRPESGQTVQMGRGAGCISTPPPADTPSDLIELLPGSGIAVIPCFEEAAATITTYTFEGEPLREYTVAIVTPTPTPSP